MEFSHIEEFYAGSLILLLLALKHHEPVSEACSVVIYDRVDTEQRRIATLKEVLSEAGEFDVFGGPDKKAFEARYHFDPDIIVAGRKILILIEAKKYTEAKRLQEYLSFVMDPAHCQSSRWMLLVTPSDWWSDSRRKLWEGLRHQAGDRAKIGWISLEDVEMNIRAKVPHEPALKKYPGFVT